MIDPHPNVALLNRLDVRDIAACSDLFADNVVFHYFNPVLPDLAGDYVGLDGISQFFENIGKLSAGTFNVEPVSVTPVGDELLVVQTRNTMTMEGRPIAVDVVVVWRIVNGRIAEVWDIPAVFSPSQAH